MVSCVPLLGPYWKLGPVCVYGSNNLSLQKKNIES